MKVTDKEGQANCEVVKFNFMMRLSHSHRGADIQQLQLEDQYTLPKERLLHKDDAWYDMSMNAIVPKDMDGVIEPGGELVRMIFQDRGPRGRASQRQTGKRANGQTGKRSGLRFRSPGCPGCRSFSPGTDGRGVSAPLSRCISRRRWPVDRCLMASSSSFGVIFFASA